MHHLLPPLREDQYAGLLGFIWLLRLLAAALCAGLLGFRTLERLACAEPFPLPFAMMSPPSHCRLSTQGLPCTTIEIMSI